MTLVLVTQNEGSMASVPISPSKGGVAFVKEVFFSVGPSKSRRGFSPCQSGLFVFQSEGGVASVSVSPSQGM